MLKRYLATLRASDRAAHASSWRRELGDAVVDVLLRERVLFDAGAADWYPCGGTCGNPRPVLHEGVPADRPFHAACAIDDGCLGVDVSAAELQLYGHSFARALDVISAALAIERAPNAHLPVTRNVHRLGTVKRRGVPTDVFVAIMPEDELFPVFVASRSASGRRTLILATTLRWVPEAVIAAHGPLAPLVEISALDELLAVRDGRIAAAVLDGGGIAPTLPSLSPPVVIALTHEGERPLDAEAYRALDTHAHDSFDLYLDVATLRRDGRAKFYRGGHRDHAGFHETELTVAEAQGVAEFIERARSRAVEATDLASLAKKSAAQLLKTGWAKVDRKREAIVPTADGLRFAPRAGTRWALIKPIAR
jgi:hypothetical protein